VGRLARKLCIRVAVASSPRARRARVARKRLWRSFARPALAGRARPRMAVREWRRRRQRRRGRQRRRARRRRRRRWARWQTRRRRMALAQQRPVRCDDLQRRRNSSGLNRTPGHVDVLVRLNGKLAVDGKMISSKIVCKCIRRRDSRRLVVQRARIGPGVRYRGHNEVWSRNLHVEDPLGSCGYGFLVGVFYGKHLDVARRERFHRQDHRRSRLQSTARIVTWDWVGKVSAETHPLCTHSVPNGLGIYRPIGHHATTLRIFITVGGIVVDKIKRAA
jgi:hypothetical protein